MSGVPKAWCGKKSTNMVGNGGSYAIVVRALGEDNALLDKRDKVTDRFGQDTFHGTFPLQPTPLTPRTGRSWSGGLARIKSTSLKASPWRSLRSRSTRS